MTPAPPDLWLLLAHGRDCKILTGIDDHSRFVVCALVMPHATSRAGVSPGAKARVSEIEDELRLAAGLTTLREPAGYSQRDVARRMGLSQPRVAAIEQSRNVTIDVLEQ